MPSLYTHNAIIIGAGPAGLFAAIRLAQTHDGILVLERGEKPGRKLLLSGSGQCNLTHAGPIDGFLSHYGGGAKPQSSARFLKPALFDFDNQALLGWFGAKGIRFETEENGKVFPADRRASSILKALQDEIFRLEVSVMTKSRVSGLDASPEGFAVRIEGQAAGRYSAPAVLIATGGASYPKTGSSGDGYALAAALGHGIIPPRPGLSPVLVRDFALESLAGLSFRDAGLAILRGGQRVFAASGDILVTHGGLSGPLVLDSSRHIAPGDTVEINFVHTDPQEFRARLDAELSTQPRRRVRTVLASRADLGLPKSMADLFCDLAGIPEEATSATLGRPQREALCRLACAHPFRVASLGSLESAMVTAGGVDLAEVNPRTMESRLVPGLFFAGEVLDIDGDTGGYNLQAAFSTGALAAKGMGLRIAAVRGAAFQIRP